MTESAFRSIDLAGIVVVMTVHFPAPPPEFPEWLADLFPSPDVAVAA